MEVHGKIPNSRHRSSIPLWPFIKITQRGNTNIILGSVQVLRHRIRGVGGPASIADTDDALGGVGADLEIILSCLGTQPNVKIYSALVQNIYTLY